MNSFYTESELLDIGFKKCGKDVLISKKCSIYSAENIEIGDHVRIDDFAILSGRITFGSYIHIAAGTYLFGGIAGIDIGNFSTISSRGAVYAVSDDYSGCSMTNPMIPDEYRKVTNEKVAIGKHAIIGTGTTILPGVMIADGVAVGAMSLVRDNLQEYKMYAGVPCRCIKDRKKEFLTLEKQFLREKENV